MTKKVRRKEGGRAGVLDQFDLFVTLPGDIPTHDEQEMMERPFFSLSKLWIGIERGTPLQDTQIPVIVWKRWFGARF